jgi:hypothetical protein
MIRLATACLLALSLAMPAPALAKAGTLSVWDGNELLDACSRTDYLRFLCMGYVTGVRDGGELHFGPDVTWRKFCSPSNVLNGQLVDVVVTYLRAHPDRRQVSAQTIVLLAFNEAWPCRNGARVVWEPERQSITIVQGGP